MREQLVLQLIDKRGKGLEVGPSYNPLAPKNGGWNVDVVDHLDAEGLRKKYAAWSVDTSKIEDVDYVIENQTLFDAIQKPDEYDFIIASNVIEHTADLVGFLRDCQRLLKRGGVLSLVVPDKRYCFDIFKTVSTTGAILQAHLERRTQHSPGQIFDQYAYHTTRDGSLVWFDRELHGTRLVHTVSEAYARMQDYIVRNQFEDAHAWVFTPSSFRLVMQDLNVLGLINMGIASFSATVGFEFFVSLKKSEPGQYVDRTDLLRRLDAELAH
ncbi:class I SAM-dependent methyltransferase [Methylocystis rosea]|nr:class I SAM-dependent methyltransferase [Methylocystis rosea]